MKKRVEKVVKCIDDDMCITIGEKYVVKLENEKYYSLLNDDGVIYPYPKNLFKVVSEREALEFEGDDLLNPYFLHDSTNIPIKQEIDLTKYNIKVIATPKDKRVKQNMGIEYNDYFLSYIVPNAWVGHITESNKAFEKLTRCSGMT